MRRATVSWGDAHHSTGSYDKEELDQRHRAVVVRTTGWVFRADKTGLTLVASDKGTPENTGMELCDFRAPFFIPRACIKKIEWLEPKT